MPPKGLFSVSSAVGFFAGVLTLVLPVLAFPGSLLVLGLIRACCLLSLCLSFSTVLAFVLPALCRVVGICFASSASLAFRRMISP